jgi:hypothetical protein
VSATETAETPDATRDTPFTVRVVDRLGRALAGSGLSRRTFMGRAAIVGAAVAVNPLRYVMQPGTAYAQVCGDGASCSSGWTAFCCTVNSGANTCPPGSYVAGWWRIDDSPFCLGAARYVIDCNRSPNASCSCRCASGSCDQRRVCCNNFRYGQCNTQIAGVTEVVCRVVTCTTPWNWDPACSRTVRVDNRTRSHNAPCLPGRDATPVAIKYQDIGQSGSILGRAIAPEREGPGGATYRRYDNGTIYHRSSTGALAIHEPIDQIHRDVGAFNGPLGFPRTEPRGTGVSGGLTVRYDRGSIYRRNSSVAPVPVYDPIDTRYRGDVGPTHNRGYPVTSPRRSDGSTLTRFQNGVLSAVAGRPVVAVNPAVLAAAEAPSSSSPDRVGWAIAAEQSSGSTTYQRFEQGIVVQSQSGSWVAIGSDLADPYLQAGGPNALGRPTGAPGSVANGRARELRLASARIWTGATGTWTLSGPLLDAYLANGGPNGSLGLPTAPPMTADNGQRRAAFEGGAVVVEPDGSVSVVRARSTSAPSGLGRTSPTGTGGRSARRPGDLTR